MEPERVDGHGRGGEGARQPRLGAGVAADNLEEYLEAAAVETVQRHEQRQGGNTAVQGTDPATVADGAEDEAVPVVDGTGAGKNVVAWEGNVGSFDEAGIRGLPPLADEPLGAPAAAPVDEPAVAVATAGDVDEPAAPAPRRGQLACPRVKPASVQLTAEESDTIARVAPRSANSLVAVNELRAVALVVEMLLIYVHDELQTCGDGCSESLWHTVKLSPTLSWLDAQTTEDDVVIAFGRRLMTFPLYRSMDLFLRCIRDVGVLLLLGRTAVLKAIARVKSLIDHSEGRHVLAAMVINPAIAWLQSMPTSKCNALLEQAALRLHDCTVPAARRVAPAPTEAALSVADMIGGAARRARPHGLTFDDLGLPSQ